MKEMHVQNQLSAYLDGALAPKEKTVIENHLRECAECRDVLNDLKNMVTWMKSVPKPAARKGLEMRLLNRLQKQKSRKGFWFAWISISGGLATALAAVIIFVMIQDTSLNKKGFRALPDGQHQVVNIELAADSSAVSPPAMADSRNATALGKIAELKPMAVPEKPAVPAPKQNFKIIDKVALRDQVAFSKTMGDGVEGGVAGGSSGGLVGGQTVLSSESSGRKSGEYYKLDASLEEKDERKESHELAEKARDAWQPAPMGKPSESTVRSYQQKNANLVRRGVAQSDKDLEKNEVPQTIAPTGGRERVDLLMSKNKMAQKKEEQKQQDNLSEKRLKNMQESLWEDAGYVSRMTRPEQLVVRNEEEWQSILNQVTNRNTPSSVPPIDFSEHMVVAVFMGEKPSGGYSIRIESEEFRDLPEGRTLIIKYRKTLPPKDAMVIMMMTQPYHMKVIPLFEGPVRFEEVK